MKILYSQRFVKQLAKQSPKVERAMKTRLLLFEEDIHNPVLHTHPLQGRLKGFYSINVTGDIRVLYQIINGDVYLYEMIGTHSQLYR